MSARDDEYGPWCEDIGLEHDWSEWEINKFFELREDRFCSRCGGMETQTICADPDCGERDT